LNRTIKEFTAPGWRLQLYTILYRKDQIALAKEQERLLDEYIGGV
jgi:hypothetical protein